MTAGTAPAERWTFGHLPALDGLRGVAVLLVLLSHAKLFGLPGAGQVGVTLFFVLSGFLITSLLIDERSGSGRVDLLAFYRRRALRLIPALVAVLAVAAVFEGWKVLAPLAYVANWAIIAGIDLGLVSHTWSLSVEEHFYALWPIAFIVLPSRRAAVIALAATWLGSVIVRLGASELHAMWGTDARADALAIGCLLAFWFSVGAPRVPLALVAVAAAALAGVSTVGEREFLTTIGLSIAALGGGVLVAWAAVRPSMVLTVAPLRWVGRVSYGLYLWHPLLYALPIGPIAIPAALAVAAASYRWIEAPFLRMKRPVRREDAVGGSAEVGAAVR
jgi:peptidoglycan/LPS O-acetylase OafA/YrhL